MRIAVPTNDGTSISEHFGRSAEFLIFETENGQIKSRKSKSNAGKHSHSQGECKHHSSDASSDNHTGILATLADCELVICAGIGRGAAEALQGRGTQIVVTPSAPAEATVAAYLAGTLPPAKSEFCRCGH